MSRAQRSTQRSEVVRCRPGTFTVRGGPGSAVHRSTSLRAAPHPGHEVERREFITFLGAAAAWPLAARAQQASKVPRVGLLFPGTETVAPARIAALREGLRAAGYREPDQVELIARVTGGDPSRVGPMASELVERNVDVLVPISPAAVQAVRSLTSTIPIVAYDLETDPIGSGLVKSLARPGGNVTGVFFDFPNLARSGWN